MAAGQANPPEGVSEGHSWPLVELLLDPFEVLWRVSTEVR